MSSPENPINSSPETGAEKEEIVFENILFKDVTDGSGKHIDYANSAPGRKRIVLSPESETPESGVLYTVKVIRDTKPEDPESGTYEVVITGRSAVPESEWQDIEKHVNLAEDLKRQGQKASQEIFAETGITKSGREGKSQEEIASSGRRKRVVKAALESESYSETAEQALGKEDSLERALVDLRSKNLRFALHRETEIEKKKEELRKEESEIISGIDGEPSGSESDALKTIRKERKEVQKEYEKLLASSPEAYFGIHLNELKGYKDALNRNQLAETDYVKEKAQDILLHMQAGKPAFIYGHLGSGKTELAMHIARKYVGKDALVISGSKNMSLAELYGHQVLNIDKVDRSELDQFTKEVEGKFSAWQKENPDASEDDKNRAHDRILETYLTQFKSGTVSDFFLGPVYRAMEEGRPVIIDEVNAIPHEILISLNHILTRRPGETVHVQQDSGRKIVIKDGFSIIMTGNLNQGQERYVDRQDMDPALLSRLYKVEYDYLPQKTEGTLEAEAGKENELFQLLLAKVMDKNGNIEAPPDTLNKLWNLSKAARVSQDVFAGKEINSAYYFQEAAGRATRYMLKESVLSIRALNNVITQWQKEGYRYELDHYLWKEFVSQSTSASDRAYFYQLLKDRFNFFQSKDWEQSPNYGSGGVLGSFDIKAPKNSPLEEGQKFFGPRATVEAAFGKAPKRASWPEIKTKAKSKEEVKQEKSLAELAELEEFSGTIEKEIAELAGEVKEFCELETAEPAAS